MSVAEHELGTERGGFAVIEGNAENWAIYQLGNMRMGNGANFLQIQSFCKRRPKAIQDAEFIGTLAQCILCLSVLFQAEEPLL